jgi:cytochrome c553
VFVAQFSRRSLLLPLLVLLPLRPALADAPAAADAARGERLVDTCSHCHGLYGEGLAVSGFPRLAGQPAAYLAKQLRDFAAGSRKHAVMQYFAQSLGEQDIADISAYYAALKAPAAEGTASGPSTAAGSALASSGDAKAGVPACNSCHGPGGRGMPPAVPYLAGQHASYIASQLEAWQDGRRHNDAGAQMAALARKLSTGDIDAVAGYYAHRTPP